MKPETKSHKKVAGEYSGEISKRHHVEKNLAETQGFLSTLIDSTDDFIWSVDSHDFGLLTWNRALQDYFYLTRNVIIKVGDRPEDLFQNKRICTDLAQFLQTGIKNRQLLR